MPAFNGSAPRRAVGWGSHLQPPCLWLVPKPAPGHPKVPGITRPPQPRAPSCPARGWQRGAPAGTCLSQKAERKSPLWLTHSCQGGFASGFGSIPTELGWEQRSPLLRQEQGVSGTSPAPHLLPSASPSISLPTHPPRGESPASAPPCPWSSQGSDVTAEIQQLQIPAWSPSPRTQLQEGHPGAGLAAQPWNPF